jgi:hypothetical protein
VELVRVNSSALEAVGYDPATRRVRIRFTGGNTYDFCVACPSRFIAA